MKLERPPVFPRMLPQTASVPLPGISVPTVSVRLPRITVPAVSVVVPAWNEESRIRKGLDSILGQTYGDYEVIVVNDESTDNTLKIAAEYADRDPRFGAMDVTHRGIG